MYSPLFEVYTLNRFYSYILCLISFLQLSPKPGVSEGCRSWSLDMIALCCRNLCRGIFGICYHKRKSKSSPGRYALSVDSVATCCLLWGRVLQRQGLCFSGMGSNHFQRANILAKFLFQFHVVWTWSTISNPLDDYNHLFAFDLM